MMTRARPVRFRECRGHVRSTGKYLAGHEWRREVKRRPGEYVLACASGAKARGISSRGWWCVRRAVSPDSDMIVEGAGGCRIVRAAERKDQARDSHSTTGDRRGAVEAVFQALACGASRRSEKKLPVSHSSPPDPVRRTRQPCCWANARSELLMAPLGCSGRSW